MSKRYIIGILECIFWVAVILLAYPLWIVACLGEYTVLKIKGQ